MGFRPLGERHAIQEVVFILNFARPIDASEMGRFFESHDLWKAELPKSVRPNVFQVFLGPEGVNGAPPPPPPPATIAPVIFQSFRRDGALEWQMQANQNWLAVNCLSYSRWDAVSKQALNLLDSGVKSFQSESLPVVSVTLQYIDTFVWEGSLSDYDSKGLLNPKSKMLPREFNPDGPAWHFHSGAFDLSETKDSRRRLMRRIHIDSQVEGPTSVSRLDISLTSDFLDDVGRLKSIASEEITSEMEWLHEENKKLLSGIISEDMQKRIALFGE
jgi:uncharacterized protein (TIGR04255 family)